MPRSAVMPRTRTVGCRLRMAHACMSGAALQQSAFNDHGGRPRLHHQGLRVAGRRSVASRTR